MEPVTTAGLALAVVPLVISALENYEYTLQPIVIFSHRYRKEVERFQDALKVQKVDFTNECCLLLHSVTYNRGNVMVDDLQHLLWQEDGLEDRLKARLHESYDACISALSLINTLLADILKETKILDILNEKKHRRIDIDWLRSLRQRSKISFSKDRFDSKLRELENRIESLHKIRKQIEHIKPISRVPDFAPMASRTYFRDVQKASSKLYDVLSSLWQCKTQKEHFANICLDIKDDRYLHGLRSTRFDLAWTCPAPIHISEMVTDSLRISIETLHESQLSTSNASPTRNTRQALELALETAIRRTSQPIHTTQSCSDPQGMSDEEAAAVLQDLCTVPNLCHYLGKQPSDASTQCVGFLQKTKTFKHLIYIPQSRVTRESVLKTLEDALIATRSNSEGIPLPEKFNLAKYLARAVLHFHSTPWMSKDWRSRDIVFFGSKDFAQDSLGSPFLKTSVKTRSDEDNQQSVLTQIAEHPKNPYPRSPVRNQTLYSLGVMLIELAYDSPLQDLQIPEDEQGDLYTFYWTATRLADRLWRELGPKYADATKTCLYGGFGASIQFDDIEGQTRFFDEVVHKLELCAEAMAM